MSLRWAITLLWLLVMAVCGWQLQRSTIVSDLSHFLPYRTSPAERVLVGQMKHGIASRLILIAIEGGKPEVLATASHELAAAMRTDTHFASVHNGEDELGEKARDFLFRYRYLLAPTDSGDVFSVQGLHRALEQRLQELASPAGLIEKPLLANDPTGAYLQLLTAWLPQGGPERRHGVWFGKDSGRALMVAETRSASFDLDGQAHAVAAIRQSFEPIGERDSLSIRLAGPPVFSVQANADISSDATKLSLLNGIAVIAILWAVYRSMATVLLGIVPLLTGALIGAATVSAWFGVLHGITLGFGAALIGVAADYPNHLFTHLAPGESPSDAIKRIWPTLRLGVLTNVAGFASMLFSGFEGLAQLGLFAAAGLIGAAMAVRWLLPWWVPGDVHVSGDLLKRLNRLPARPRWGGMAPIVLGLGALALQWTSPVPVWNNDIESLSPVPASSKSLDESLRRELGAPDLRKLIVVMGNDAESVLVRSEAVAERLGPLVDSGTLGGFDMAASYLPSISLQRHRQATLPATSELAQRMAVALEDTPFKTDAFGPFLGDIESARRLEALSLDSDLPRVMALKVNALLFADGDSWVGLVPLRGVTDQAKLERSLAGMLPDQVMLVDLHDASSGMLADYRGDALHWLGLSTLAIVLLLLAGLRSWEQMLRVLAPMLCAAMVTALIMARWSGGLSLFHLVSLMLVMGLSLDQALFFNRAAEHDEDRARTVLSLLLCNVSAVIAFGILATSSINILHEIGATVAIGAALALLFGALLASRRRAPS